MTKRFLLLFTLLATTVGCPTGPPKGVTPVTAFDVERYLGKWYEIARLDHSFERGLSRVTAEYALNDDGTIKVVNRGYSAEQDKWKSAEGTARFRDSKTVGSLKVSFFGPFYAGYHIIELDDDYEYALVSGSSKDYLWILSRAPWLDESVYQRLLDKADALGFPTEELIRVTHETSSD